MAGRQGGGVASSAASRCPSSAYWHEEEGDRELGGLGRQGGGTGELAQVSLSLCFMFLFIFYFSISLWLY